MANLLKIYSYSKCGTCRKAIKWLDEENIKYELIDIITNPPTKSHIIEAIKQLGDRKYLLNTSGKSYRSIGAQSIKSMSDHDIIELICSDSKLIKRPFAINSLGKILVGFNQLDWQNFVLN